MTDGLLSIRHQKQKQVSTDNKKKKGNYYHQLHGIDFKPVDVSYLFFFQY